MVVLDVLGCDVNDVFFENVYLIYIVLFIIKFNFDEVFW